MRFPNRHKIAKRAQRLVGRLHERLNAVVLPRFKTSKAMSADEWAGILAGVNEAIDQGYAEAEQAGLQVAAHYGIKLTDDDLKKINAAVDTAYEKATSYTHDNLKSYIQEVSDKLDAGTITDTEAQSMISSRLEMYAEPVWNVFQQVKGQVFDSEPGLLLEWHLDPASDHCEDCPAIADDGPYTTESGDNPIPTWPGDGDTACRQNCNCDVTPTEDSWNDVMAPIRDEAQQEADLAAQSFT